MHRIAAISLIFLVLMEGSLSAGQLRDPFEFGSHPESRKFTGPILMGVLWDATNPLIIVGDRTLALEDEVGSWRIIGIQDDGVMIERGGERTFLSPGNRFPE